MKGKREEPPRGLKQDIFVLMNHCEMNYISINDETCSCKYKLTLIPSSSLDEILFTDRLIFGNIGIRDR